MLTRDQAQKQLQELLSAARGALEEALSVAEEHDLWFDFSGIRRGPGDDLKTANVNDPDEVAELERDVREFDGKWPPRVTVDVLDISEAWVGSWC